MQVISTVTQVQVISTVTQVQVISPFPVEHVNDL